MLAEGSTGPFEARQAYRRMLDLELEAPAVDPRDEESVSEYMRYKRQREREDPEAVAQQRRQEAALQEFTF